MGEEKIVTALNINDILPNRFQPRIKFSEDKIEELAESIRKYGVIQPIIVRSIGNKYEIIAGERRYKASVLAGLKEIPAIISDLNDKDSSEIALIENVQREDLTSIEEAISYKKILDMGDYTQEELASKLGMSQSAVANKLRLLNLAEEVQEALLEKKISERHARSLLKLKSHQEQKEMLERIIRERLTVRRTDEEIKKLLESNSEEQKNLSIPTFLPNFEEEKKDSVGETEVMEILNKYFNKNKEEEKMNNNDPMNQFDVPTVDIVNDNPSTNIENNIGSNPVPNISTSPEVMPSQEGVSNVDLGVSSTPSAELNPGFMDIDKIQREAVDIMPQTSQISVPQNPDLSQTAPISEMPSVPQIDIPAPQTSVEPINPIVNEMPQMSQVQESIPTPISAINVGEEDSNNEGGFSSQPQAEGKFFDVLPSKQEAIENNMDGLGSNLSTNNSFDNNSINELNSGINMNNINQVPNMGGIEESTNVLNAFNNDSMFTNIPSASVENNVNSTEESPIPNLNVTQEIPVQSPDSVVASQTIVPTPEIVEQNTILNQPSTPVQAMDNVSEIPAVPPSISNMNELESTNSVMTEPSAIAPSLEAVSPTNSSVVPLSYNMREAINVVRNLVPQLEALGIRVDIEEMDLVNLYEITIKLMK